MKPTGTAATFVGEMSPIRIQAAGPLWLPAGRCKPQGAGALGNKAGVAMVTDQKGRFSFKVGLTSFLPGECGEEETLQQLTYMCECIARLF